MLSLLQTAAGIHRECNAGNVARFVGGQEEYGVADVAPVLPAGRAGHECDLAVHPAHYNLRLADLSDRPNLWRRPCLTASQLARQEVDLPVSAASISVAAATRACTTGAVSFSDVAIAVAPSNSTDSCCPSRCGSAAPASRATAMRRRVNA